MERKKPQTFSEIYGQDKIVEILKKIAISDILPIRALSLIGPTGTGKTSLMRIFARALNCIDFHIHYKDLHARDVCNTCIPCMDSTLYFEADALTLTDVKASANMLNNLIRSRTQGLKRLIVFEEVQLASEEAINMLLRHVEEGIPNTVIAFNSTKPLPQALQDRCLTLKLNALTNEMVIWLIGEEARKLDIDISPYQINLLAGLARGQLRPAFNLLDLYNIGGMSALRTPYPIIMEFLLNKIKKLSNEETIRVLMTYLPDDIVNAIKLLIVNSYKELGITETAMLNAGLTDKLYNFIYEPQNVQAVLSREGLEAFLHRLSSIV